ncbi:MAG: hypothetical protein ACRD9S_08360 [Pyrinomonadaceae bacterium]
MALTKTTLNEITPSQIQQSKFLGALNLQVPRTTCGYHVDHVVNEISSPEVREIVGTVFEDLLRLLECLSLIESHLRQADAASETFALFQIIHAEARALVKFISEQALTCEAITEEVYETLDGITFAINHDLHRVFDNQQRGADATSQVVVGQLFRAHDLLTNCLQQSTISLAITFDRKLDGAKLFDNSDMRYRRSIQLCENISMLLELVGGCAGNRKGSAFATLTARVEVFRNESLECLMYSDWPQFEGFCEKISSAELSTVELESVLHQFRCYLETLLGQVRMRAVLANVLPAQFGADHSQSTDEHVALDPFALAV